MNAYELGFMVGMQKTAGVLDRLGGKEALMRILRRAWKEKARAAGQLQGRTELGKATKKVIPELAEWALERVPESAQRMLDRPGQLLWLPPVSQIGGARPLLF